MVDRTRRPFLILLSICLTWSASIWLPAQEGNNPSSQSAPSDHVFRAQVTLVPLDVVVLDKQGRPVLDLNQGDFEVLEDGRIQEVINFSLQRFGAATTAENLDAREAGRLFGRTFLIVLGRVPSHRDVGTYFEALGPLVDFVSRMKAPDRVAVLAYDRITDFGHRYAETARFLRSYQKEGVEIESVLTRRFSHALFASQERRTLPPKLQAKVDRMIERSDLVWREVVTPYLVSSAERKSSNRESIRLDQTDLNRQMVSQIRRIEEEMSGLIAAGSQTVNGTNAITSAAPLTQAEIARDTTGLFETAQLTLLTDVPRGEYAARRVAGDEDLNTLFSAIEYLRFLDDEKHLLFLSPQGLLLPKNAHYEEMARMASHYRIRLHALQTSTPDFDCVYGATQNTFSSVENSLRGFHPLSSDRGMGCGNIARMDAFDAIRKMTSMTGGRAHIHKDISLGLAETDRMTRASYLLGYRPEGDLSGKYRRIRVRVKRGDLTVLARQGYFAHAQLQMPDQEKLRAYVRTLAAANTERPLGDIPLELDVTPGRDLKGDDSYRVDVNIDFNPSMVQRREDRFKGHLVVAYFFGGGRSKKLWPRWDRIGIDLTPKNLEKISQDGIRFEMVLTPPVKVDNGWLKLVVYDPLSDRVGTISKRLYAAASYR